MYLFHYVYFAIKLMLVIDILLTKNIKNDNNSISNNMISSLVEDNDKNLWIGTDGGLNKMNLEEEFIMGFGLIYRR